MECSLVTRCLMPILLTRRRLCEMLKPGANNMHGQNDATADWLQLLQ